MRIPVFIKHNTNKLPGRGGIICVRWLIKFALSTAMVIVLLVNNASYSSARGDNEGATTTNLRVREYSYKSLANHWQLVGWETGRKVCDIYTTFSETPDHELILENCGLEIQQQWLQTPLCNIDTNQKNGSACSGLMMRYVQQVEHEFNVTVEYPTISLKTELRTCLPGEACSSLPQLKIIGIEPVQGYKITSIHTRIQDYDQICNLATCEIYLPLTGEQGAWLEYWAKSDFGDESEHITIKYRTIHKFDKEDIYYLDILADEWSQYAPSGSAIWDMFPPMDTLLPEYLEQPIAAQYLATSNRYVFLAGNLIQQGKIDASACPGRGLAGFGVATTCGEQAAADAVISWQNKYDELIYAAAVRHNIPAYLLKGIIAQESQFWPVSDDPYELGLGRLTENGLNLILLWNQDYYLKTCIPVLGERSCSAGYASLLQIEQLILRGQLITLIGTDAEIDLLAAAIEASALQTGQLVRNTVRKYPADATSYVDMWLMTIGNYYAGSGCIDEALKNIARSDLEVNWKQISGYLSSSCQLTQSYVERVLELAD